MSNDLRRQMVELEEQKCGFMQHLMNNRSDDMDFLKSFIPYITPLDTKSKMRFRLKFQQLVNETLEEFEASQ
ncbi:hypothetical protein FKM82_006547 [Ascaphus truei]